MTIVLELTVFLCDVLKISNQNKRCVLLGASVLFLSQRQRKQTKSILNMKKIIFFIALITQCLSAQTIKGVFPKAKEKEIVLKGYDGFTEKELSKTHTDSLGKFSLNYPKNYIGAGLLQIQNSSSVIVLLNKENFEMQWENLQDFNSLKFINSPENDAFSEGNIINQEAEQKLHGLKFLLPQYKNSDTKQQWLSEEITNQEQQFTNFLNQLPKDNYAKYYLKIRKLITDFPQTANRYIERMPQHEKEFNLIDFNNSNLHTSGLLKELLEGYFKLMESHTNANELYQHINTSLEAVVKSLAQNPTLQQEVAQHLFNYFEKRSLYKASEHLALTMLNQANCQLSDKSIYLFEQYRKLAIGKTAPNIVLNQKNLDLKNLNNKYRLVVFGASWCPNCQTDYPSLIGKYKKLKESFDLEVVYISLDTDKKAFEEYYKEAPFITFFDGKGWETLAAKDYHVFATPTYILLDKNLNILAKINSPEHLDAWLQSKGQ